MESSWVLSKAPAVFAVGGSYQIMAVTDRDMTFWVKVGDECYFDHFNGIMRSNTRVHRVCVPTEELDREKKYTVYCRVVTNRTPYYPELEPPVSKEYSFRPIDFSKPVNVYHISDAHGNFKHPSEAGSFFGDRLDLLILNGDIPNHNGDRENTDLVYELCDRLTKGEIPCVFARGNHDMRGCYAEFTAESFPNHNGRSYYTFRLGKIWGIVLDTGEDKPDGTVEYGGMGASVACSRFRREETKFIEGVIKNASTEYAADGIEYRLVIAHKPFTYVQPAPFDIEQDVYSEWVRLLGEYIKPDLMISGHLHKAFISHKGGEYDSLGQFCPVIVGAVPVRENKIMIGYTGTAMTFDKNSVTVRFTDHDKNIIYSEEIDLGKTKTDA